MSSSTTNTSTSVVPEIEYDPEEDQLQDLDYGKVAAVYAFKSSSPLHEFVMRKAGHLFYDTISTFSLYRLLMAAYFIIEEGKYFDPFNPTIVWCSDNDLYPIFQQEGFHLSQLEDLLLQHVRRIVDIFSNGWIRIYPKSRRMAFRETIAKLERKAPSWGRKDTFSFSSYGLANLVDEEKRIVQITPELKHFLTLKKYSKKTHCYKCMFTFIDKYVRTNLKCIPYGIQNIKTLYIACTDISAVFGNCKAFTSDQLKRFIKSQMTSGYGKGPVSCHPSLTDDFFNLTI